MVERIVYNRGAKMIRRFPAVSADIFHINVGTAQQREDLIKQAWGEHAKNDKTLAWTNRGCWRSNYQYQNIDWLMQAVNNVVNEAGLYYQQMDPVYSRKTKSFLGSEIKYWTNINKPGSRNALHEHKLWHYVAVYYLDAESTGDILFYNPINLTEGCNPYAPFVSPVSFSPTNGDLLIWPAWLPHEVEMNQSNKHRINIAMNIRFTAPVSLEDVDNENY